MNEPSGYIGRTQWEFSVVQFFASGEQEYARRFYGADEAVQAFNHYTSSMGVKLGFVTRVIITDGGDCTNMEWQLGKGITFPLPEVGEESDPLEIHE